MTFTGVDLDDLEQLDSLLDALQARQRARAEARPVHNAAGREVTPGQQAAGRLIVAPGDTVASVWGNTTYDQTMQVFLNPLDRDTQWPSPHDGATCYTVDTGTAWIRKSGVWLNTKARYQTTVRRNAALTAPATANSLTTLIYDSVVTNQGGNYSTSTGIYSCPYAGVYQVIASLGWNMAQAGGYVCGVQVWRNGTVVKATAITQPANPGYAEPQAAWCDVCAQGDTLSAQWFHSIASATGFRSGAETQMNITYLG